MPRLLFYLLISTIARAVQSITVTYNFNISWVIADPDGSFRRPVIGINDRWPLPVMRAHAGDRILVNVFNKLGNQSTSLHFHGLAMRGSPFMDGPAQVSQCAIPPGASFQYDFEVSGFYSVVIKFLK